MAGPARGAGVVNPAAGEANLASGKANPSAVEGATTMNRTELPARSLATILALVGFLTALPGATAPSGAASSRLIRAGGAVHTFGEDEVYVAPFLFPARASAEAAPDCELPNMYEYLVAAKDPELAVSDAFEPIQSPPEEACEYSREVLEAEGVAGYSYFAGLGPRKPEELEVVHGGTDARETITRMSAVILAFWDKEHHPSPLAHRCITRKPFETPGSIQAARAEVKTRRSEGSKTKMTLPQGTAITVLYREGTWSFIKATGPHPCQKDPEWTRFEDYGWILNSTYR